MAIWRAVGASPSIIIGLLMIEAFYYCGTKCNRKYYFIVCSIIFTAAYGLIVTYGILVKMEMLSLEDRLIFVYFILSSNVM